MGSEVLQLGKVSSFDDRITGSEYHAYNPFTNSYNYNDEIRIVIQNQDLYVLPHKSYIYIEGRVEVNFVDEATNAQKVVPTFVNNAAAFLFDEIRYELNGFPIDICKNVGITSTLKGYVSFSPNDMARMETAGWARDGTGANATAGYVNFCIPLKSIFGFAEDYQNIVMNAKHELILLRSRSDVNALCGNNNISTIKFDKIQWRIPHITVSDSEKLKLLQIINKKQNIQLNYRTWELYEYPVLPTTTKHVWSVKTSSQLNTPRFIVIAFQTARNNIITANKSRFDHCQLSDLKVFLNSESYPYESLNLHFTNNTVAVLYDMYSRFQESFYHDRPSCCAAPMLSLEHFKTRAPLVVIDCSRQNESLKKSVVDIRIELQTREEIPENTTAFCMIIHDNIVTYNPYSNIVNRMV